MLLQELAGKNAEMMEEVARVRLNLNSRIEQLENDCRSNRVSALEKEISGQFVQTEHYFFISCIFHSGCQFAVTNTLNFFKQ